MYCSLLLECMVSHGVKCFRKDGNEMNDVRRKELQEAVELLDKAMMIIEGAKDEEEDAYYNLPESLQESERAEKMYENVEKMGDMYDTLDEMVYDLIFEVM